MTFSRTAKESFKTALAMVVAYAIALTMDWDKPYWAGYAVAFVSLSSIGQSLNKAALRMAGTMLAVPMAFLLLALFSQERWLFILTLSLWVGFCTYMAGGEQRQYFWICAGFICAVIAIDAGPSGENAFKIAILRSQETGLGILVYSLIASLLWPVHSGKQLDASVKKLMAAQKAFYHGCHEQLLGQASTADVQEKMDQVLQVQGQFDALLAAAVADTYEIWESRDNWQEFQQQTAAVTNGLGLWRGSLNKLGEVELKKVLPGLGDAGSALEQRFADIELMFDNQPPARPVAAINLKFEREAARSLAPFQSAELAAASVRWRELESQTRGLFECVARLQGFAQAGEPVVPPDCGSRYFAFDTERFCAAVRVMTGLWIAYLAWIFVPDLPGGSAVAMMTVPLGMNLVQMPQLRSITMLKPAMLSVLGAGIIYIFIMPQLSTFLELGLLLFAFTFTVTYFFSAPDQALGKALGLSLFL
ncbi:MAG: FUSC family protein, partial [Gammaproteobacteria bacterium]